jgi:hypothetical protein
LGTAKTKVYFLEEMLDRIEVCNFYRLTKNTPNDFTLFTFSEVTKDFIRIFHKEYSATMGAKAEIKKNLTKLRVTVKSACSKIS